jgi:hypothetical protein
MRTAVVAVLTLLAVPLGKLSLLRFSLCSLWKQAPARVITARSSYSALLRHLEPPNFAFTEGPVKVQRRNVLGGEESRMRSRRFVCMFCLCRLATPFVF